MQDLFSLSGLAIGAIPVVLGLVEIVKQFGIESKWASLASIVIGIGVMSLIGDTWQIVVAQGILIGLAASGLYSGGKKLLVS